jgi:hypothetical protein
MPALPSIPLRIAPYCTRGQRVLSSLLENCDVESRALCESSDVLAVVVLVATELCQSEVVSFKYSDPQVPERFGIHVNQSRFVALRDVSHVTISMETRCFLASALPCHRFVGRPRLMQRREPE